MGKIILTARTNYGTTHLYVKDVDQAKYINMLTGKKTIDRRDIEALKGLGYTVEMETIGGEVL